MKIIGDSRSLHLMGDTYLKCFRADTVASSLSETAHKVLPSGGAASMQMRRRVLAVTLALVVALSAVATADAAGKRGPGGNQPPPVETACCGWE